MQPNLTLYGEAAVQLGTTYAAISALVKAHGLTPKPVPRNGNAKGLDPRDMRVLRKALNVPRGKRQPATAPAQ